MTLQRFKELLGNFCLFVEAFTSVKIQHEKHSDTDEDMKFYTVTFNEHEFMSFKELCELTAYLRSIADKNGFDISDLKLGRDNRPIDFADTEVEEV